MKTYFEAPNYYHPKPGSIPGIFLAGGITGVERWHTKAVSTLQASGAPMVVFNPNRRDFPISDPGAGWEQVSWEQHHLHLPGVTTLFWFPACDPAVTTQPIALIELGQAIGEGRPIVVGADPLYPRRADVVMMCRLNRLGMPVYDALDDVLTATIAAISTAGVGVSALGQDEASRTCACGELEESPEHHALDGSGNHNFDPKEG